MTARQQQAMSIFAKEWPVTSCAAVVGALSGESGVNLDSTVFRVHANMDSGGIAEWRLDRKTKMIAFVQSLGRPQEDLAGQCLFVINELETDARYAWLSSELKSGLRKGKSTAEFIATTCWNFVDVFERPSMAVAHMDDIRVPQSIKVYNDYIAAAHKTVPPIASDGFVVGTAAGGGAIITTGQVPPWATVIMGLISAVSYLVTAFNVKSKPVPLPVPEQPQVGVITVPSMTALEEFRRDDAIAKAALVQRQKSLDKVKAQAAELNEIVSHEDVKIIDHTPAVVSGLPPGTTVQNP